MGKLNPQATPVKVVAITAIDGVFRIPSMLKLNKAITWRTRWNLQFNINYAAILVKEIFNLRLPNVAGQVTDIDGPRKTTTHCSQRLLKKSREV